MPPRQLSLSAAIKLPVPLSFEVRQVAWKPGQEDILAILACRFGDEEGSDEVCVQIFNLEESETLAVEIQCRLEEWRLEWSPSGKMLPIVVIPGDIILYNSGGSQVGRLSPRDRDVSTIEFNNSETLAIVFGNQLRIIEVLDVDTGASRHEIIHGDFVREVVWKDESHFFTCDLGNIEWTIKLWRVGQEIPLQMIPGQNPAWNPRSGILAFTVTGVNQMPGFNQDLNLWTPNSVNSDITILSDGSNDHYNVYADLLWSPGNPDILASLDSYEGIKIWDTATGTCLYSFEEDAMPGGIRNFSFSPDGHLLAYCIGTSINVRNTETGELVAECEVVGELEEPWRRELGGALVRWSPLGDKLAMSTPRDWETTRNARILIFHMKMPSLRTLALIKVATCLKDELERGREEKEEVVNNLEIPKRLKPKLKLYL